MSHLSQRIVRRAISRPNAAKALERIEKELRVLIENSPIVHYEYATDVERHVSSEGVTSTIESIKNLYRTP